MNTDIIHWGLVDRLRQRLWFWSNALLKPYDSVTQNYLTARQALHPNETISILIVADLCLPCSPVIRQGAARVLQVIL